MIEFSIALITQKFIDVKCIRVEADGNLNWIFVTYININKLILFTLN